MPAIHRKDVPADRNDAIRDLFLSAATRMLELATIATVQELVGQHLLELQSFIAAGQTTSKFYPNGITRIRISVKAIDVTFDLEIEGS